MGTLEVFQTSDIFLAAFLKAHGHDYQLTPVDAYIVQFVFRRVDQGFVDAWDRGQHQCDGLHILRCYKNLQSDIVQFRAKRTAVPAGVTR